MKKNILVLYYSQTGQLNDIIDHFLSPIINDGHYIEKLEVQPLIAYPFPWTGQSFFSIMPDCLFEKSIELKPIHTKLNRYDLIVIGYQPWFLSPSLPVTSMLNNDAVKSVLKDTPVITITGARNMWIGALESIKASLKKSGALLKGNIVLYDRNNNWVSAVTISHWMFKGKKDKYLNVFPMPGVSASDIKKTNSYGSIVVKHLNNNSCENLQQDLINAKAIEVKYNLLFMESKGKRIFKIWASLLAKQKKDSKWFVIFKYYLLFALFILAPILICIDAILFKPFLRNKIQKRKEQILGV